MTNKAVLIRKMHRKALFGSINKMNGFYYYVDKNDNRVYRVGRGSIMKCKRLEDPHKELFAIPDTTTKIRFSQTFDANTNTFILKEYEN